MSDQSSPLRTGQDNDLEGLLADVVVNMSDDEEVSKQTGIREEEPTINFNQQELLKSNDSENLRGFPTVGSYKVETSQFESEDSLVNKPLNQLVSQDESNNQAKESANSTPQKDLFEMEKTSEREITMTDPSTTAAQQKHDQEKELTDILVDAAFKKLCTDHNQMIVTICTDFSCPRRFWCGICCVKSKDLYVRFSTHMTLISDFLEENIKKLYQVKTFTETDKAIVGGRLNEIGSKNQGNFEETWKLIDRDIEAYKAEVIARIDSSKNAVKTRFNKSVKTINSFYEQLKDRIKLFKTRDVSLELEALKAQVSSGKKDALEAIESIGNKVNIDIFEVESLNQDFDKTRDFVDFIYSNYAEVRRNTVPNYVSMEKQISALADKVEALSMPKIKSLLEDSNKELDSLLAYYESLLSNEVPTAEKTDFLIEYLCQKDEESYQKAAPVPKDVDDSMAYRGKASYPDRKIASTFREPERQEKKNPAASKERAVDHTLSLRESKLNLGYQRASQPAMSPQPLPQQNNKILSIYSSFPSTQMINAELMDLTDRTSSNQGVATNALFDGCLCPLYNEAEIDSIENDGSLAMTTENREFVPIIYLHNNSFLFSSFQKKDLSTSPPQIVYGFKVLQLVDDHKQADASKIKIVYSSDSDEACLSASKINHITVIERDSDNTNLVCVNREDGTISILSYYLQDDSDFLITPENGISPQSYEGQITTMRRLGNSDFLVCTNSRGEILTFDTIRCELISSEKSRPGLTQFAKE